MFIEKNVWINYATMTHVGNVSKSLFLKIADNKCLMLQFEYKYV
jgi:hypothetical protein